MKTASSPTFGFKHLSKTLIRSPFSLAALLILFGILTGIGVTFFKQISYMRVAETEESVFEFSYLEKTYEKGPPSKKFIFGSDDEGILIADRTFAGARISLIVGIVGALVSVFVGTLYGARFSLQKSRISSRVAVSPG